MSNRGNKQTVSNNFLRKKFDNRHRRLELSNIYSKITKQTIKKSVIATINSKLNEYNININSINLESLNLVTLRRLLECINKNDLECIKKVLKSIQGLNVTRKNSANTRKRNSLPPRKNSANIRKNSATN